MSQQICFSDGGTYERYMGVWSQRAGAAFLDWLAPDPGLRWIDVGCGNGAFTEMIVERCAPASVRGIDPSGAQLAHARQRPALRGAGLCRADAMALPFAARSFDAAVMPLVIFFVPEPARGVAEMARVVGPGGIVAAYAWDMDEGGFPYDALLTELRAMGVAVPEPPSPEASRREVLEGLWSCAGLEEVSTRAIAVERTFDGFDDYWTTVLGAPSVGGILSAMPANGSAGLQARMRARLPVDADGRITCGARANAVKGLVAGARGSSDTGSS